MLTGQHYLITYTLNFLSNAGLRLISHSITSSSWTLVFTEGEIHILVSVYSSLTLRC